MVTGSPTSWLHTGGELIRIQLEKKHKCMADEQFYQTNNKWDITKTRGKKERKIPPPPPPPPLSPSPPTPTTTTTTTTKPTNKTNATPKTATTTITTHYNPPQTKKQTLNKQREGRKQLVCVFYAQSGLYHQGSV